MIVRKKHPLLVRVAHWLNFPILTLMIWSGALIYWANPEFWPTLPEEFYTRLGLDHRLAEGLAWHFTLMWLFAINGLIYVSYVTYSGEWRDLVPQRKSFRLAIDVVLHDLRLSKKPIPPGKINHAQRFAYTSVLLMGAGAVISGIAIYKPVQLWWVTQTIGGYSTARLIHYLIAIGFVAFFAIHLAQVIRAGWNHFRAMIVGFEVVEKEKVNDV